MKMIFEDVANRPDKDAIVFVAVKAITIAVTLPLLVWKPAWALPLLALNVAEAVLFGFWKGMLINALIGCVVIALIAYLYKHHTSEMMAAITIALYAGWNTYFTYVGGRINGQVSSFALNILPVLVYAMDRLSHPSHTIVESIWLFVVLRYIIMLYAAAHVLDPESCHGFVQLENIRKY